MDHSYSRLCPGGVLSSLCSSSQNPTSSKEGRCQSRPQGVMQNLVYHSVGHNYSRRLCPARSTDLYPLVSHCTRHGFFPGIPTRLDSQRCFDPRPCASRLLCWSVRSIKRDGSDFVLRHLYPWSAVAHSVQYPGHTRLYRTLWVLEWFSNQLKPRLCRASLPYGGSWETIRNDVFAC